MTRMSASARAPTSVLVVDDDPDMCWVIKVTLELSGHAVTVGRSGSEALRLAGQNAFPVALIDARLPDMDGLQLAAMLALAVSNIKIVIISGYYSEDDVSIVEARRAMRVHGFLGKPFQIEAIEAVLDVTLQGTANLLS